MLMGGADLSISKAMPGGCTRQKPPDDSLG
jgi:hypothetical protein